MDLSNLDSFRKQIAEAQTSIAMLNRVRRTIDERVADLRDLVRANANFLPDEERECELLLLEMLKVPETIAEAVKIVLFLATGRKVRMTPVQIKEEAQKRGFDFSSYTNPMASIHSILKRMKESDPPEADFDEQTGTYRYLPTALPAGLGKDAIDRLNQDAWDRMTAHDKEVANKISMEVVEKFVTDLKVKRKGR